MMNRWSRLVALRKEAYLTMIALHVTRVSGIGEDTIFMGILKVATVGGAAWLHADGY